jgi:hypothetical protein
MKKLILYGNSQIIIGIKSYLDFLNIFDIITLSSFNIIYDKVILNYNIFNDCDIFIYQPVSDRVGDYSSNNLLKFCNKDCIKICIPFIYIDSFFQMILKNNYHGLDGGNFKNNSTIINQNIILDLKKLYSNDEIINLYNSNKIDFKFNERFTENINRMKEKEKISNIKIVDFILDNFKKHKLMSVHVHPTKIIFDYIAEQIYKLLNIENNINENKWNGILSHDEYPYSRYSINYFNFEWIINENNDSDSYYLGLIENILNNT